MATGQAIERMIDFGVAGLFAIACAFPAFMLLPDWGRGAAALAAGIGALAFIAALRVLARHGRRVPPHVTFDLAPLPNFPRIEPLDLSLDERLEEPCASGSGLQEDAPLELDVALPELGPGARVVQLFGAPAQATAGELALRIDRHLARREPTPAGPPDSAGDLFDALHQLRQSLR